MTARPRHLENLPPMTPDLCSVHILREEGYVTLVMRLPSGKDVGVFTFHQVEATKLAARISEVVAAGDGATSLVEGAHLGGPPDPDQLLRP